MSSEVHFFHLCHKPRHEIKRTKSSYGARLVYEYPGIFVCGLALLITAGHRQCGHKTFGEICHY